MVIQPANDFSAVQIAWMIWSRHSTLIFETCCSNVMPSVHSISTKILIMITANIPRHTYIRLSTNWGRRILWSKKRDFEIWKSIKNAKYFKFLGKSTFGEPLNLATSDFHCVSQNFVILRILAIFAAVLPDNSNSKLPKPTNITQKSQYLSINA